MAKQGEAWELPRIRVPRHLRQTHVRRVGDAVNLMIPFQGKPQPQVIWTKDGQPLDTKRINIRSGEKDTIFFIREAQRSDSGKYQLTIRINGAEDKATVEIQVIEPPGPPQNLKLVDVWGFNVALEWTPPADNGNSEIKGYVVQKSDKKSGKWFTVLERCTRTSCTISDLIMGNTYSFRVFAENASGLSEKAAVTSSSAHIKKTKTVYQPEKIPQRDMMEPPKFTQPLTDRTTTRGYSTHLFCSVRGFPQPKIIWMKNQMEIREDPKYIAMIEQGVCSLEIRKPSPFDGGVYTCKAVNPLGEASVDCKLDVKGTDWIAANQEPFLSMRYAIQNLGSGEKIHVRVRAVNANGASVPATLEQPVLIKEILQTVYQPEKIPQRDMMEPPKFTQPLTDRTTTRGYSTHLFCSVRGFPQPKIIWMKNQMEIREDPKYIAMIEQGVCSLEIRKPSPFDGGVYTCKAVNPLGEASVDCKLDVKETWFVPVLY
nr:PREDICTED: myosin-binding protein H [Apteryx mantelli mantelli]